MHLNMIAKNFVRAMQEPSGILRWLKREIASKRKSAMKAKRNASAATLADRVAEIRAAGHRRVAVFSDRASIEDCKTQLPDAEVVWISSDYADVRAGAGTVYGIVPESVDGFLLVGGDVSNNYRLVLRWLEANGSILPVYWVAQDFEFCGGTTPIAAACSEADVLIFNHFSSFFGQHDPLLVRVEVFDQYDCKQKWFLMRPNESIRIRLSEWLPARRGTACVLHHCTHPRLTSGRHDRWRATSLYQWRESIAMAHGDTGFSGPNVKLATEHKIGIGSMVGGKVAMTMPNYNSALVQSDKKAQALNFRQIVEIDQNTKFRIDEATFVHDGRKATFEDFFGVRFLGSGGSFWFSFDDGSALRANSLSANHSVRGELEPHLKRPATEEAAQFVADLAVHDVILDPHAMPIEASTSPIEFGFDFDMNFPVLRRFDILAFGEHGRYLGSAIYEKTEPGAVYAGSILEALEFDGSQVRLLILSPDWISAGADPRGRGAAGNLVVRLRRTGDYDATEFQNSWRNLGFMVGALPHWLSQDRMLNGRTNLLCGIVAEEADEVAIVCVNASGRKSYSNCAELVVRIVAADGSEMESRVRIDAFCYKMHYLDEIMRGWRDHLAGGFGCLIVKSLDADLNASVVTVRGGRGVALQHMWGY